MRVKGRMMKIVIMATYLSFAGLFCLPLAEAALPLSATSVIEVPTDFPQIRMAVENSVAGGTIYVASGRYDEYIPIRRPLHILGQEASRVLITGTTDFVGFAILAEGVTIEGISTDGRLFTGVTYHITLRDCIFMRPIALNGAFCKIDHCIIAVPQSDDTWPNASPGGRAALYIQRGSVASNNLILRAPGRDVGHFEGEQPPFITPTPYGGYGEYGPFPGFAPGQTGIAALDSAKVINNTIVNIKGGDTGYLMHEELSRWSGLAPGHALGVSVEYPNGAHIANNVICNIQAGRPHYPNYNGSWASPGDSIGIGVYRVTEGRAVIENNIIWDADYGIVERNGNDPTGLVVRNNRWAAPGFVNPASDDYRLLPGSPAIDAGTTVAWLTDDIDGNPRPVNFGWDIGAFEYQNLLSDLNGDGVVNALDLNIFIGQWGMELPKMKAAGGVQPAELTTFDPSQSTPTPRLVRTPPPTPMPAQLLPPHTPTPTPCDCPLKN